jgi:beta-lactam-binding protein with PASTA domain
MVTDCINEIRINLKLQNMRLNEKPFNPEKLTEKLNAVKVTESIKNKILKISDIEGMHIQQVVRRLIERGTDMYFNDKNFQFSKRNEYLNENNND